MIASPRSSCPPSRRPLRRPGISLLEVLLAMAIFLMAMATLGTLIDVGGERGRTAALKTVGTRLAQSKLAELEAGVVAVSAASSGTFDDEPDWQWAVDPQPAGPPNTYAVTVRAWREVGGRKHEVRLTQVIYDPAQMGAAGEATPPTTTTTTTGGTSTGMTTGGTMP